MTIFHNQPCHLVSHMQERLKHLSSYLLPLDQDSWLSINNLQIFSFINAYLWLRVVQKYPENSDSQIQLLVYYPADIHWMSTGPEAL